MGDVCRREQRGVMREWPAAVVCFVCCAISGWDRGEKEEADGMVGGIGETMVRDWNVFLRDYCRQGETDVL
jgi:hypothetical protein